MTPIEGLSSGALPADPRDQLRHAAKALEGVFIRQLFQAMRDSVPSEGAAAGSPGEQTFTALLDDTLADLAAQRMERGLGEALYRQLSRRLQSEAPAENERTP